MSSQSTPEQSSINIESSNVTINIEHHHHHHHYHEHHHTKPIGWCGTIGQPTIPRPIKPVITKPVQPIKQPQPQPQPILKPIHKPTDLLPTNTNWCGTPSISPSKPIVCDLPPKLHPHPHAIHRHNHHHRLINAQLIDEKCIEIQQPEIESNGNVETKPIINTEQEQLQPVVHQPRLIKCFTQRRPIMSNQYQDQIVACKLPHFPIEQDTKQQVESNDSQSTSTASTESTKSTSEQTSTDTNNTTTIDFAPSHPRCARRINHCALPIRIALQNDDQLQITTTQKPLQTTPLTPCNSSTQQPIESTTNNIQVETNNDPNRFIHKNITFNINSKSRLTRADPTLSCKLPSLINTSIHDSPVDQQPVQVKDTISTASSSDDDDFYVIEAPHYELHIDPVQIQRDQERAVEQQYEPGQLEFQFESEIIQPQPIEIIQPQQLSFSHEDGEKDSNNNELSQRELLQQQLDISKSKLQAIEMKMDHLQRKLRFRNTVELQTRLTTQMKDYKMKAEQLQKVIDITQNMIDTYQVPQ